MWMLPIPEYFCDFGFVHTDAFSVRSAVLSFFSPKTRRMFRALSFLLALSTFTLEPHGTAQYFSSVYTELWMATRLKFSYGF